MININGKIYAGRSISISNGQVTIDGKKVNVEEKYITIAVEGNVDQISADHCEYITVNGGCKNVQTLSGEVNCSDVHGNVTTMSGDVYANDIAGNVSTMSGDITTIEKP